MSVFIWPAKYKPTYGWHLVTPDMAAYWLTRNAPFQRKYDPRTATYFAGLITSTNFYKSNDSITFDIHNWLTNGQHRLGGIVEAGLPAWLHVHVDFPEESFMAEDRHRPKTVSTVTGRVAGLLSDAVLCYRFMHGTNNVRIPEHIQNDISEWWEPAYLAISRCGGGNGLSTSAVRVGAGLRWATEVNPGARNAILAQIKAMSSADLPAMNRATGALWRWLNRAPTAGTLLMRMERACRVYHYLHPGRAKVEPLLKNVDAVHAEMKGLITKMEEAFLLAGPTAKHVYDFQGTQRGAAKRIVRLEQGTLPIEQPTA